MSITRLPSSSSGRWRIPFLVWVGVGLLGASIVGVFWGLHVPAGDNTPSYNPPKPVAPLPRRAVCIAHVDVRNGVIPLSPVQPGRVVKVEKVAREGTEVEAGTPLFSMDEELARAQLTEAEAALKAAEAQVRQADVLPDQHDQQVAGQQSAVAARKHELAAARIKLSEVQRLRANDLVRVEAVQMAQEQIKVLEAGVAGEEAKLRALQKEDPKASITRAREEVAARKAQVEKAQLGLKECIVKAPCKGKVLRLQVNAGETVGANPRQPALIFCPSGPRIVRAEVEQEFADRVSRGQTATIQDDTRSGGPTWKGTVTEVSDWFAHRRSVLLEPLQFNDVRTLECIIEIEDKEPRLRIGQRVRVTLEGP